MLVLSKSIFDSINVNKIALWLFLYLVPVCGNEVKFVITFKEKVRDYFRCLVLKLQNLFYKFDLQYIVIFMLLSD